MRDKKYYTLAHEGSLDLNHPAMQILLKLFSISEKILDMGCGEGTRLTTLIKKTDSPRKNAEGIDVSEIAIKLALKKYPGVIFKVADLERLPYKDNQFDLLYSAYVFEHLTDPEKVIKEAFRVLKPGGFFMIIAPNFGSPNRRSPNSTENKIAKLIFGFIKDIFYAKKISLDWQRVIPKSNEYTIDADTTVEPYLLSLIRYSKLLGFKSENFSSNWEIDNFSSFQSVFKFFGSMKIFPFVYWGPHISAVFKK